MYTSTHLESRHLTCLLLTTLFKFSVKESKFIAFEKYLKLIRKSLVPFVLFVRMHSMLKFNNLIELCVVDIPGKMYRFSLSYYILSLVSNMRLRITIYTNEII